MPQDIADPERERRAPLLPERFGDRPETARPPAESDPPMSDVIDPDVLDIDALLPVAFDTGAARVMMGQDLAELLRSAEERLESRSEPSRPNELDDDVADVPVPDDVLALLAEPLESDEDEIGTGALGGGSSIGTGADRPGTDVPHPTRNGEEEDLEQPLPRASDPPRESTGIGREGRYSSTRVPPGTAVADESGRPVTAVGRETSSPGLEMSRGSSVTMHEVTAEHGDRDGGTSPRGLDDGRRERLDLDSAGTYHERGTLERPLFGERGTMPDRLGFAERPSERGALLERATAERAAFAERGGIDRGAALIERAAMGYRADERAAARGPTERGSERAFERPPERAFERPPERAFERPPERAAERVPHGDGARWQTAKMVSPAAIEIGEAGPRSRAARTDAMPAVLGPGDAARALGRAIASRVSGALVVTAGSSAPVESLVAFLAARGDIDRDLVPRLSGKLPTFGRHAGAALVANGYLGQDDLWPVLRAHAEWIIGRAILVDSGTCELEADPPARFKAEPSVFGGATGAEVFVDAVQRVVAPEAALARLGGYGARLASGPRLSLLGECALSPEEEDAVRVAGGHTVHQFAGDGPTERWSMLHALVCLEVLEALPAVSAPKPRAEPQVDPIDDDALRAKVRARLALVEEGDYFALLGVTRGATAYEIRRAYLDLRRTFEPARMLTASTLDLADDVRLVVEVVEEAYEILRDTNRRERYRRAIEGGPPR